MNKSDLLGWELDDVLEGYEVAFVVEPVNALCDPHVRARLDRAHPEPRIARTDKRPATEARVR